MTQSIVTHAIGHWYDGSTWVEDHPQRALSTPFVVRISKKGWIPVNVMLFALNAAVAKSVVLEALEMAADGTKARRVREPHRFVEQRQPEVILDHLAAGTMKITCEPFPRGTIAQVSWASNDHI